VVARDYVVRRHTVNAAAFGVIGAELFGIFWGDLAVQCATIGMV
jgi:hypothetical protein